MYALLGLGTLAFVLCLALTPVFRYLSLKLGLVDQPDHNRKVHKHPIPRTGGVAIVLSYALALCFMVRFAPPGAAVTIQHRDLLWSLFPAVGLIFLIGLVDDLLGMKAWHKLLGQIVAALWAVSMGARVPLFNGHPGADWVMWPLSVLWLVGCTNAFNLIDGMDGLASGVGLFATFTTLLAALLQGNWGLAMATVPLAGCLLAFLRYNFNPASIFLGDSGSLTIGFLLGCFGVIWSQKSATLLGMIAPLMAFSLPLFEVCLSIGRRFLRNQPIFQPDRGHIHHRLLSRGLHPRAVALILYAACGIAAVLSLLQSSLSFHLGGLIIILFCSLSLFGIRRLNYIEFRTAGQVLRQGRILQMMQGEIHLENFRDAMNAAKTLNDCWNIICEACEEMDFCSVRMVINGQNFQEVFKMPVDDPTWQIRVKLKTEGQIVLIRSNESMPPALTGFLKVLQEAMSDAKRFAPELKIADVSASISLLGAAATRISKL
ncbi:MAG: undecaprenyl/decaprenyl-phosphate alpha-N-acetylglucosaminyl 1-phosphate transferase [Acidobacteriaceae bacterium]|nr:undecaprenyl/decaprenyl-phosphate alpha-N-acetylglucosaminyl 1-phosphate transferase [Acidobacteriaceae bacterium]